MKKTVLCLLVAAGLQSSAQTVAAGSTLTTYHDVYPDTLLNWVYYPFTHETYSVDIFSSVAFDYRFDALGATSSGGSSAYITITSLNPDMYMRFGRFDSIWVVGESR